MEVKDSQKWLYELYLATAEKTSDRRAAANARMLSVNSAIVAFYGYLQIAQDNATVWLTAIPAADILGCLTWSALLDSYRKLNKAKFTVLMAMETAWPVRPFTQERELYKAAGRRSLTRLEILAPWSFIVLHSVMLGAAIWP